MTEFVLNLSDSIPKIADYSSEMIWDGHLVVAGGKTVFENQTSSAIDATSHFFCIQLSVLLTKPVQYMLMISHDLKAQTNEDYS